jgi:hypothetical protein
MVANEHFRDDQSNVIPAHTIVIDIALKSLEDQTRIPVDSRYRLRTPELRLRRSDPHLSPPSFIDCSTAAMASAAAADRVTGVPCWHLVHPIHPATPRAVMSSA